MFFGRQLTPGELFPQRHHALFFQLFHFCRRRVSFSRVKVASRPPASSLDVPRPREIWQQLRLDVLSLPISPTRSYLISLRRRNFSPEVTPSGRRSLRVVELSRCRFRYFLVGLTLAPRPLAVLTVVSRLHGL